MNVTKGEVIKVLKGYDDNKLIDSGFVYELSKAHKGVADKALQCELFVDYQNLDVLIDTLYTSEEVKKYSEVLPEGAEIPLDEVFNAPEDIHPMNVGDLVRYIENQPFI